MNVVCHSDINLSYNQKSKIAVLAKGKTESLTEDKIIEKLKVKIMISSTEDSMLQLNLMEYYKDNKQKGKEFLENMLKDLTNGVFVSS